MPRNYHSAAVLLQDGRVFAGGGGLCGDCDTNHYDAQIFEPPYLFNADGSPAKRPTIAVSASIIPNGNTITVTASGPLSQISIVRYGTSTHTVNTDQRRIELCGRAPACAAAPGFKYSVTVPADPGVAPPGPWMVFGIAGDVPSVSKTIMIGSGRIGGAGGPRRGLGAPPDPAADVVSPKPPSATAATTKVGRWDYPETPADPAIPMPPGIDPMPPGIGPE